MAINRKKDFKDLKFKTDLQSNQSAATLKFKNGYQIVVRSGKQTATTLGKPYEFEMFPSNQKVVDDIVGYLDAEEITLLLHEVQSLSKLTTEESNNLVYPKWDW